MNQANLWIGTMINENQKRTDIVAERVFINDDDESFSVIFSLGEGEEEDNSSSRPKHVSIRWNGAIIMSAIDIESDVIELSGNPGRILWHKNTSEKSGKIYFVVNRKEIALVCDSIVKRINNSIETPCSV